MTLLFYYFILCSDASNKRQFTKKTLFRGFVIFRDIWFQLL